MSDNATDASAMLGIEKAKAEAITSNFQFTVKSIGRVQPAEINQELFDKLYGAGKVNSVEEFRNKIKDELSKMFSGDSEQILKNEIIEALLVKLNIKLPDEFLKRWLMTASEKPVTYDEVSKEYEMYSKSLQWQLIENRVIKDNQIKVGNDEVVSHLKEILTAQLARYGRADVPEEELTKMTNEVLKKEQEVKQIYEKLYNDKVMALFKNNFTIEEKEVPYEEIYKPRS